MNKKPSTGGKYFPITCLIKNGSRVYEDFSKLNNKKICNIMGKKHKLSFHQKQKGKISTWIVIQHH